MLSGGLGLSLSDFTPRTPWWGGDLQTLRNYLLSCLPELGGIDRGHLSFPAPDGSGDRLLGHLRVSAVERGRPLVVLIHGLSGSESSCYMIMAAAYFLERGYPVLRLNLRGAGPSRPFCRLQYHAAGIDDLHAALSGLEPALTAQGVVAVGFSLGGSMLLTYLAEYGNAAAIQAGASVSAPIDLALASKALLRWRNAIYQRYMLAHLKRNCTAKGAALTEGERRTVLRAATIHAFDHGFTAPRAGYADAESFYAAASARRRLALIRTPTLVVHARDDPFVPVATYDSTDWAALRHLTVLLPASGGHLGFHDPLGIWHLRCIDAFLEGRGALGTR